MKKHEHKFNVLTISNMLDNDKKEHINIVLECACDDDKPQCVVSFIDNDLLSAKQNYHGWLSSIAPALVQEDFRINDQRIDLIEGGNDDKQ